MKALEKAKQVEGKTESFWHWLFGGGRTGGSNG